MKYGKMLTTILQTMRNSYSHDSISYCVKAKFLITCNLGPILLTITRCEIFHLIISFHLYGHMQLVHITAIAVTRLVHATVAGLAIWLTTLLCCAKVC